MPTARGKVTEEFAGFMVFGALGGCGVGGWDGEVKRDVGSMEYDISCL